MFSFGISDNPEGIELYKVGAATGVIVTGCPAKHWLPPPFNLVINIRRLRSPDLSEAWSAVPTVPRWPDIAACRNLALLGERGEENGDNLLAIEDDDVADGFRDRGAGLIDHFSSSTA